jgi:hypothetical protein
MYVFTYACAHTHTNKNTHTCRALRATVSKMAWMSLWLCMHADCLYIYIHTDIHTYTHTYLQGTQGHSFKDGLDDFVVFNAWHNHIHTHIHETYIHT